ncbi:MAG: hypothetical protein L6Q37_07410 [Bdellovibrionaceae bacterium]|nr:hypothetical protein [Pseudobdellovibrionaceae bacterium]
MKFISHTLQFFFLFLIHTNVSCRNIPITTNIDKEKTTFVSKKELSYLRDKSFSEESMSSWSCDQPHFSSAGDKLIFWCYFPFLSEQRQIFIKDLNTSQVKQVTFLSGTILDPVFVGSDSFVFSSDTDKRKELISLEPKESLIDESFLELYLYDLKEDNSLQLTENQVPEMFTTLYKHIDPKIVFVRRYDDFHLVIIKNLSNHSEKEIYRTKKTILELSTNNSNNVLIMEKVSDKLQKMVMINFNNQVTEGPELDLKKHDFFANSDFTQISYLESKDNKTFLRTYRFADKCEVLNYVFPSYGGNA